MKDTNQYSDEFMHRYVDGELTQEETEQFISALQHNENIRNRICQLQHSKQLLKHSYPLEQQNVILPSTPSSRFGLRAVAAICLLLIAGFLGGWINQEHFQYKLAATSLESTYNHNTNGIQTAVAEPQNIILHIDSAEVEKQQQALDYAEYLLNDYKEKNIAVEVIANSAGIDLFRAGASPYQQRLETLLSNYDNLRLIACSRALARLQERGEKPVLIPQAHIGSTALDHIVKRLQQGWTYKKI